MSVAPALKVREARYSDLPAIARVKADAFHDDNLWGDFIHPYRREHPEGMYLMWLRRSRFVFWDYATKWYVVVEEDAATGQETVVGQSVWRRSGHGAKAMQCQWYDPRGYLKPLSFQAMRLHSLLWPNHARNEENEATFVHSLSFLAPAWTGKRAECWILDSLTVSPDHQGKGIGKLLVKLGLDRAEREGVCVSVISSWKKDGFYQKAGFEIQDGSWGMGEGNPLAHVPGGNMWWKMPSSQSGVTK